jgi:hypothetical protein
MSSDFLTMSTPPPESAQTDRPLLFRVIAPGFSQEFDRWTDALNTAKSLMPNCRWFDEIRILAAGDLVWVYSRSHKFPQFIGAGTYDRLARLFLQEALAEEAVVEENS